MLKQTVKAAEDHWATRKKQIIDDTRIVIQASKEAIDKETVTSKRSLASLKRQLAASALSMAIAHLVHAERVRQLRLEVKAVRHERDVLLETNGGLLSENRDLASEVVVKQKEVEHLKETEETINAAIVDAQVNVRNLRDDIDALTEEKVRYEDSIASLEKVQTEKVDGYEKTIALLEAKKESLSKEIIENRSQDDKIRENLASWGRTLEEKDKNLRIREAAVAEKEKAIVRNYNLLNL
jgi:chromosome segregation ATPase